MEIDVAGVLTTTSASSLLMVLPRMMVPVMGVPPIAAVEIDACVAGVAVSPRSGPLPEMRLPMMTLLLRLSGRQMEVGADVGVKGNAGETIVQDLIVDDGISRDEADSGAVGEDADTSACAGKADAIVDGLVAG